ncbi:hypothetical protein [Francisella marina]|uniref:Lipoprotein n=1 Tax=Francisella marina TaxID=2249302 RepID=A0ABX5ZGK2_9GAMM|nr:hypothetical protein [Francisella marina]QEO57576.1 hypothetical protein F0R74_06810 [Francisella marina]
MIYPYTKPVSFSRNTYKFIYVLIVLFFIAVLSSCDGFSKAVPAFGKTNSATDQSTSQMRVDPSLAISANGNSSSYKGSVHEETSTNTDNNNDNSTGSKNVFGILKDKSVNTNNSTTETKNGTQEYHGSVVHHNDISTYWWLVIIAIAGWVLDSPQEIIRKIRAKK